MRFQVSLNRSRMLGSFEMLLYVCTMFSVIEVLSYLAAIASLPEHSGRWPQRRAAPWCTRTGCLRLRDKRISLCLFALWLIHGKEEKRQLGYNLREAWPGSLFFLFTSSIFLKRRKILVITKHPRETIIGLELTFPTKRPHWWSTRALSWQLGVWPC